MSWRGESWAEIVRRASATSRETRSVAEREDPDALAARAQPWAFEVARVAVTDEGIVIGSGMESVVVAFAQLYHVEPIDPWPSLALGWVDRGDPYSSVLSPAQGDVETFARAAEEVVEACERRVTVATARGWLEVAEHPWEPAGAMPGEGDDTAAMGGYRMAPAIPDPIVAQRVTVSRQPRRRAAPERKSDAVTSGATNTIVASRATELPDATLWTWLWAHLRPAPRRIEPKDIVLTKRFVYVRTRARRTVRIPASLLRASHRTADGDAVYVFARNTELFLAHQPDCPLAAALDARLS